jgi:hypothetical protein
MAASRLNVRTLRKHDGWMWVIVTPDPPVDPSSFSCFFSFFPCTGATISPVSTQLPSLFFDNYVHDVHGEGDEISPSWERIVLHMQSRRGALAPRQSLVQGDCEELPSSRAIASSCQDMPHNRRGYPCPPRPGGCEFRRCSRLHALLQNRISSHD